MRMNFIRKGIIFFLKLCVSSVIAISILSLFSLIYYNPPISAPQDNQYTNSAFVPNRRWSLMTEGWGFGKTNDLGYIDSDYSAPTSPDIIVMGSSHTEALQVNSDKNYVSLTETMFAEDMNKENDYSCLNLGVSGHTFAIQISNLPYMIKSFNGMKYVVIETSSFDYTSEEFRKMLDGEYHTDYAEKSVLYTLAQKVPYFRLLFKQCSSLQNTNRTEVEGNTEFDRVSYETAFTSVAESIAEIAKSQDFEIILLYHTRSALNLKNTDESVNAAEQISSVKDICSKNGIHFLDSSLILAEHFQKNYQPPYGFSNTTLGSGHLNETGHQLIAQQLYDYICQIEEGK